MDAANRHQMIVATKVYQPMEEQPNNRELSLKHILETLEASLRCLRTDYFDLYLYLAHALDDALRARKIRYVGDSNYPAWRLIRRCGRPKCITGQGCCKVGRE